MWPWISAVDRRRSDSGTARRLSADNRRGLWVPPGFAHGFCVTSDTAEFTYKVTDFWTPTHDRSLIWNDPDIGIEWPDAVDEALLSEKDRRGVRLADAEINYVYTGTDG